jgi:hypothetical protein
MGIATAVLKHKAVDIAFPPCESVHKALPRKRRRLTTSGSDGTTHKIGTCLRPRRGSPCPSDAAARYPARHARMRDPAPDQD